jgi:hypothetical protein
MLPGILYCPSLRLDSVRRAAGGQYRGRDVFWAVDLAPLAIGPETADRQRSHSSRTT